MTRNNSLLSKIFLIILSCYLLLPFVVTLVYSVFMEWTNGIPSGFTLRNYTLLFSDIEFWLSIGRTILLCTVSVLFTIIILLLAMYVVVVENNKGS